MSSHDNVFPKAIIVNGEVFTYTYSHSDNYGTVAQYDSENNFEIVFDDTNNVKPLEMQDSVLCLSKCTPF